jgi:hypothetical protein
MMGGEEQVKEVKNVPFGPSDSAEKVFYNFMSVPFLPMIGRSSCVSSIDGGELGMTGCDELLKC